MSWGGGWGRDHVPASAEKVAEAFYEGRPRKRSNCECYWNKSAETWCYLLEATIIAQRRTEVDAVTHELSGSPLRNTDGMLKFTFGGWPTHMTARHLRALGIRAEIHTDYEIGPRGGRGSRIEVATMNGKEVSSSGWYTLNELGAMPDWKPQWCWRTRAEQLAAVAIERARPMEGQLGLAFG